jgi:hypothetical protein
MFGQVQLQLEGRGGGVGIKFFFHPYRPILHDLVMASDLLLSLLMQSQPHQKILYSLLTPRIPYRPKSLIVYNSVKPLSVQVDCGRFQQRAGTQCRGDSCLQPLCKECIHQSKLITSIDSLDRDSI